MPCSRSKAGGGIPAFRPQTLLGTPCLPRSSFGCPALHSFSLSRAISNWNLVVAEILLGRPRLRAVGPDGFKPPGARAPTAGLAYPPPKPAHHLLCWLCHLSPGPPVLES